jgi:hypothetical protein
LMPKLVVVIPQQQVATTPFFHRSWYKDWL